MSTIRRRLQLEVLEGRETPSTFVNMHFTQPVAAPTQASTQVSSPYVIKMETVLITGVAAPQAGSTMLGTASHATD
jgi:hypothetical protein